MRRQMRAGARGQAGSALVIALLLLAVGSLTLTGVLSITATNLQAQRTEKRRAMEYYAAEAGQERAVWNLANGFVTVPIGEQAALPQFSINNASVNVTIENPTGSSYEITSVAVTPSSTTTIRSKVYVVYYFSGDFEVDNNTTYYGPVYVTGSGTIRWRASLEGDIATEGDLHMENNSTINGNIACGGDLTLDNNAIINGNVCVTGNLTIANSTEIHGDVVVGGNLVISQAALVDGGVWISGSYMSVDQNGVSGAVYADGPITIEFERPGGAVDGDVYSRGAVTVTPPEAAAQILGTVYENYTSAYPPPPDCVQPVSVVETWDMEY